jgi:hypothetical protein
MKGPFDTPCSLPISVRYHVITSDRDGIDVGEYGLETSIETIMIQMLKRDLCPWLAPIKCLERTAARNFVSRGRISLCYDGLQTGHRISDTGK